MLSMAWKLHYIHHITFPGLKGGTRYQEFSTDHLIRLLDLQPLKTRLDVADLVFLHARLS